MRCSLEMGAGNGTEAEETTHVHRESRRQVGAGTAALWKALEGPGGQCFRQGRIRACCGCRIMCRAWGGATEGPEWGVAGPAGLEQWPRLWSEEQVGQGGRRHGPGRGERPAPCLKGRQAAQHPCPCPALPSISPSGSLVSGLGQPGFRSWLCHFLTVDKSLCCSAYVSSPAKWGQQQLRGKGSRVGVWAHGDPSDN